MLDFEKVLEVATQNIDSLYPPDKRHKGIICPICGNGQGKDGDGVTFVSSGSPVLKCFRCDFSGDVINMTAKAQKISYREAAELLAEKLGIDEKNYQYDPGRRTKAFDVPKVEYAVKDIPEEKIDQTEYFKKVEAHLTDTDYPAKRGLSLKTCRHFHLGFDAHWKHPKIPNAPPSPRLIIPTSDYSYLARDVRSILTDIQKRYSKQKFGSVSVFNIENVGYEYTFITEGEIDAMSLYELCGANAVALGSVSNIQKLVDYLKTTETKKPKYLIAALDNDDAGREGNLKLKKALNEIGIKVLIADFIYRDLDNNIEYKDANEILVKNREAFADNVELIWSIPAQYYESDKFAGQIIDEITIIEDKPYDEEELASMIKEPEFTAENLKAVFEDVSPELAHEFETLNESSAQVPVTEIEAMPVSREITSTESFVASSIQTSDTATTSSAELEKSKNLLSSITEFNNETIFSSETLQAAAYCKVYAPFDLIKFLERCRENKIEITLFKECIQQIAQPVEKIKRRDDRQKEKARVVEEVKRKKEQLKIERYNNSVKMDALLNQSQSPERDRKLIEFVKKSLERDFRGKVNSSSVANFELALNFDPIIRGCVGYDAFSQKIVARRKLPWTDKLSSQTFWTNYDNVGLQNYLNRTYELNNERIFFNVISEYAHKNSFHPVRDYLNNLPKWDGVTRAAEYFIENLEIEDNRYSREVIKSWMSAAIARVFHPGCKWDYILVIKGAKGVGKSTVFSKLAGKWFNDSTESIDGSWIAELCKIYERRAENFLKQCVFVTTTSDEEFLKDCTDDWRFLILVSKAEDVSCKDRLSKLKAEHTDQIWAEIFYHYNQLFSFDEAFDSAKLLPDNDILEMAKKIRENYTEGSELAGMIEAYLEMKIPDPTVWDQRPMSERREYIQNYPVSSLNENSHLVPRKAVSAVEIAYELLSVDNPCKEKDTLKKISNILSKIEGWHRVTCRQRGVYGQQRLTYERLTDSTPNIPIV